LAVQFQTDCHSAKRQLKFKANADKIFFTDQSKVIKHTRMLNQTKFMINRAFCTVSTILLNLLMPNSNNTEVLQHTTGSSLSII